ncbi:hypothetical protein GCM10010252_76150 [Streptomyces aureoverticillatus]|nr:hypothetical protein GCM10010252_76150 [Streptomyces aureoverticillatus]
MANCVLIASDGDALLVDTPYTASLTRSLIAAAQRVLPTPASISRVVNTHANGDHAYGNSLFPHADIISTDANLDHLCLEPAPEQLQTLLDNCQEEKPFDRYLLAHFGRYDYSELSLTQPSHTFTGRLELHVGDTAVELIEVGPAHTAGDLIVHLPDSGVVCTGDILFIGDVPVHWAGPLSGVLDACQKVLDLKPAVIVPGHGPLARPADLRDYMDFITAVREHIHSLHAQGLDVQDASRALLHEHRHTRLGLRERLAVLTSTEYRHLNADPHPVQLLQLLDSAVRLTPDCVPTSVPARHRAPHRP